MCRKPVLSGLDRIKDDIYIWCCWGLATILLCTEHEYRIKVCVDISDSMCAVSMCGRPGYFFLGEKNTAQIAIAVYH